MKLNRRIITVMAAVCSLFLVMVIYLTYFALFKADELIKSSYNPRIWEKEERILRGNIYDRKGTLLAESKQTETGQKRIYPYGSLYTHSIGYNTRTYGKTNIELSFNSYLLETEMGLEILKREAKKIVNAETAEFNIGANLHTTLDHGMMKLAKEQLGGVNGSVVVLNPVTGEVYCMYSNPTFDPNEQALTKNWETLKSREDSPFVARATSGLYAPGSTFKTVTAAAGIENGLSNFTFNDEGKVNIGGYEISNAGGKAYGTIGMDDAIRVSSNVYFSSLAAKLGKESMKDMIGRFLLTESIPFDIETRSAKLDFGKMDKTELAVTGIGQGKLQISPLHMALVAATVANHGVMMKPYMVESAGYESGKEIYKAKSQVLAKVIDASTAAQIDEYMKLCVQSGTGTRARVNGVTVAGKTGTAENEKKGKTHAWFICYAPAENPQIAMCVMKEYAGSGGGSVCAPVAAQLIRYSKNNGLIQ